jgi:tetratricopeptide (TPR) repeat protein
VVSIIIFFFRLIPILLITAPVHAQDSVPSIAPLIEDGDRHWDRRAIGAHGALAESGEIDLAIAAYRQALASSQESLTVQWRLMRALCFKGEYTTTDIERKKQIFAEGKAVGEHALRSIRQEAARRAGRSFDDAGPVELAHVVSAAPDAVGSLYWSMANLGLWALAYGKLHAAREGVAGKIRDLATAVMIMDPSYERGGGYRALGRLHHETPYIPLITGWASTTRAVEFLRKADQVAPGDFANRLYLADTLWDWNAQSRREALTLVEEIVHDSPRETFLVEDRAAQEHAQGLLTKWQGK